MSVRATVMFAVVTTISYSSEINAAAIFAESGGQVVVEAETFSSRTASLENSWLVVPDESSGFPSLFDNFRGTGYIQALPEESSSSSQGNPPFADYTVRITTLGDYRLYVRFDGYDDGSDTFFANILELSDGPGGSIADWYRFVRITDDQDFATTPWAGSGGFERTDSPFTNGEEPVVWNISTPGDFTIRLDMRETGMAIDAFVFQLSSLPAPTGIGPPASGKIPAPGTGILLGFGLALFNSRNRRSLKVDGTLYK